MELKTLSSEVEAYLSGLDWPGNVRQIENTCRWLTVMSPGQGDHRRGPAARAAARGPGPQDGGDWQHALQRWADQQLAVGGTALLERAMPEFERIMIETALKHTGGRRQDAARLLGWGRNTLTRKIRELGMEEAV